MQPLWETVWNFQKKLKMDLPFDPVIPLLGLYPKNPETPIQRNLYTTMFIAAQLKVAKCWRQPKCPSVNEWIEKLWYIHTMEYYTEERKKELLSFTITKCWKQPKCLSVNEWIIKLWYIHTMEYCTAERKKELLRNSMGGS